MITVETSQWYAVHGALSDPGVRYARFDGAPADVPALCRLIQGVLIHLEQGVELYGGVPWAQDPPSRATLPVAQRLAEIGTLAFRPPAARVVGTCRDFALMLCAMLRHQGVPARVRCGFATYFDPGFYEDHWVCEYWQARDGRWAMADAQLDEAHRRHFRIDFDCADLPARAFLPAAQVWQRCRSGALDPAQCGHGDTTGLWFVAVDVVRDLLALHKREISPRDGWRDALTDQRPLIDSMIAIVDRWAGMAEATDQASTTTREAHAAEIAATRPFWRA